MIAGKKNMLSAERESGSEPFEWFVRYARYLQKETALRIQSEGLMLNNSLYVIY